MSTPRLPCGWGISRVPAPLQRLFDHFPLVTYEANNLPWRAPGPSDLARLYVFVSEEDAHRGAPSFNPTCLKWQTFLKLAGVRFRTVPSSNHASPTGALPFLLPPTSASDQNQNPIPSTKLYAYALENGGPKSPLPVGEVSPLDAASRFPAYESLLDDRLRPAWLYSLYLCPRSAPLLTELYAAPASSTSAVRAALVHQLRRAAAAEIHKKTGLHPRPSASSDLRNQDPVASTVLSAALLALSSLDQLLANSATPWFFDAEKPTLFDAEVFSYTHLLLWDSRMRVPTGRANIPTASPPRLSSSSAPLLAKLVPTVTLKGIDLFALREHHSRLMGMLWPEEAHEGQLQGRGAADANVEYTDNEEDVVHVRLAHQGLSFESGSNGDRVSAEFAAEDIQMTESVMNAKASQIS